MRVYLVYFFYDYLEMYHAMHKVEHVVMTESKAIELINAENDRLKKRQDYNREQNAYFEMHEIKEAI